MTYVAPHPSSPAPAFQRALTSIDPSLRTRPPPPQSNTLSESHQAKKAHAPSTSTTAVSAKMEVKSRPVASKMAPEAVRWVGACFWTVLRCIVLNTAHTLALRR